MSYEHYDFALSFAGENRSVAKDIYTALKKEGFRVFYDFEKKSELWGKNLNATLREIYRDQCTFVVCLFSPYYQNKEWTQLEFSACTDRMLTSLQHGEFLLPILLDGAELPEDLPSTIGFEEYKTGDDITEIINYLTQKANSVTADDAFIANTGIFIDDLINRLDLSLESKNPEFSCDKLQRTFTCKLGTGTIFQFLPDPHGISPCIKIYAHPANAMLNTSEALPDLLITRTFADTATLTLYDFHTNKSEFGKTQNLPYDSISGESLINRLLHWMYATAEDYR